MAQEMVELEEWKPWLCEDVARLEAKSEAKKWAKEAQAVALAREVANQVPDDST